MATPGGGGGGRVSEVDNMSGKRLVELLEILQRQEKLLSNTKFVASLPDRGEKILAYTEKVRAAIAQYKRLEETTGLLSAFKLEFEEKRNNIKERSQVPTVPVDKKTVASSAGILQNRSSGSTAYMPRLENTPNLETNSHSLPMATASEVEHNSSLDTKGPPLPVDSSLRMENRPNEDTSSDVGNTPSVGTDRLPLLEETRKNAAGMAVLLDGMKSISIEDGRGNSIDASETSVVDKDSLNYFAKKSPFFKVLKMRAKNPICPKEKFQTNRLPSTPYQSPGERALKLSVKERRAQDWKHLDDITAATLPPLHHSPAQLLPLEESLTLQIAQRKRYEENQANLATQKLYEKLNIKMEPFNPEGDSYMKYRDQNDEEGQGADE